MLIRHLVIQVILILCAITAVAQERPKITVNSNGDYVIPPQLEEHVRHRQELLKNPDFLSLTLKSVVSKNNEAGGETKPFEAGKKISFNLLVTNTLSEPFIIDAGCYYDNTRPLLMKDGATIPYLESATKSIENKSVAFRKGRYTVFISTVPVIPEGEDFDPAATLKEFP